MPDARPLRSTRDLGPGIADFIAAHMGLTFGHMLRGPNVQRSDQLILYTTGQPHPFGNAAVLARADDPTSAAQATSALAKCNAPSAIILPDAPAPVVADQLKSAGFVFAEHMPRMAMDLEHLKPSEIPEDHEFVRITTPAQSAQWVDAFAAGYELPRPVAALFAPDAAPLDPSIDAPAQFFAILKRGRMVSTSMVYMRDGVAGIYCISTAPQERGRGLGAFVTAQTLRVAGAQGYAVGILQASEAGHPIYRKLGFAEFGAMSLFVRIPG